MKSKVTAVQAITSLASIRSLVLHPLNKTPYSFFRKQKFTVAASLNDVIDKTGSKKIKGNNAEIAVKETASVPALSEKDKEIIDLLKPGNVIYPYKSSTERLTHIFVKDVKIGARKLVYNLTRIKLGELEYKYFPRFTDILVIGGDFLGLLIAYILKINFPKGLDVIVIDKNIKSPQGSLNLSQGTLLYPTFTENVEMDMSHYCYEFLSDFSLHSEVAGHEEFKINYEPTGSLFLANESNGHSVMKRYDALKQMGILNKLISPSQIKEKFPWLNVDKVIFGCQGFINEGLFDPWLVLHGLRAKLVNLGVTFVTAEVIDFGMDDTSYRRAIVRLPDRTLNSIDFSKCVFTCGTGTKKFVDLINSTELVPLKIRLPLERKKTFEYCMYNPDGPGLNTPIIINTDGTYFRREGLSNLYVAGVSNIPADENEEGEEYKVFESKIRPFLTSRIPGFEDIELKHGWISTYDNNTANEIGIIGPHPCNNEIFFAVGFNKHGFLYAPAVARGIYELIAHREYQTIDLSIFHLENLYLRQHLKAEEERRKQIEFKRRIALGE